MITRRQLLKITGMASASAILMPHALAQTTHWEMNSLASGTCPFILPSLPYPLDALEPHIDASTLESHHGKHHAAYVKKFNFAMYEVYPLYTDWKYGEGYFSEKSGELVVKNLHLIPKTIRRANGDIVIPEPLQKTIRDSASGHYNHSLYWQMMKKNGGGEPTGELAGAIKKEFGSFTAFKKKFTQAALAQVGEGWAWLTLDGDALKVETLPNEENPLSLGRPVLLGIDLWDHAYQLKYGNNRAEYVAAWFKVIDWDFAAERYSRLKPKAK